MGGEGGAQRPILLTYERKKMSARRALALSAAKKPTRAKRGISNLGMKKTFLEAHTLMSP